MLFFLLLHWDIFIFSLKEEEEEAASHGVVCVCVWLLDILECDMYDQ